jgi:hypothetical protein
MKSLRRQVLDVGFWLLFTSIPAFCGMIIEDSFPAVPGGEFSLNTDFGEVIVQGASGNEVSVRIELEPEVMDKIDPRFYYDAGNITIRAEGSKWYKLTRTPTDKARFIVSVPEGHGLNLKNRWGNVELRDVTGRAQVRTCRGSIAVDSFAGPLELEAARGGIVLGEIEGSVKARTKGGPIQVEGFKGEISVKTFATGITIRSEDTQSGKCELYTQGGSITLVRPPSDSTETVDAAARAGPQRQPAPQGCLRLGR